MTVLCETYWIHLAVYWLDSYFSCMAYVQCSMFHISYLCNVLQTFGIKADLLGLLPGRQTYVFDINGKCVLCFNDQLNSEKHVEEALKAIKACTVNA